MSANLDIAISFPLILSLSSLIEYIKFSTATFSFFSKYKYVFLSILSVSFLYKRTRSDTFR